MLLSEKETEYPVEQKKDQNCADNASAQFPRARRR
jgi:hypothetical protein